MDCKEHPCAPHGFDRTASHSNGEYVCECESWTPPCADEIETLRSSNEELRQQRDELLAALINHQEQTRPIQQSIEAIQKARESK